MNTSSLLLRRTLAANAAFSGLSGVVLLAGARPIAVSLGVPKPSILIGLASGFIAGLRCGPTAKRSPPNAQRHRRLDFCHSGRRLGYRKRRTDFRWSSEWYRQLGCRRHSAAVRHPATLRSSSNEDTGMR